MTASRTGPRYRLELSVGDAASDVPARTMDGADCTRLAEAAALILALHIEPDIDVDAPPEESNVDAPPDASSQEPPEHAEPPPEEPSPRPASPVVRPKRRRGTRPSRSSPIELGARVVLDHGSLPRTTLGLQAIAGIGRGPLSLDLGATIYAPQFAGGPRAGAGGADVSLATFTVRGCAREAFATVELHGCLGAEAGREETRGVAIAVPLSSAGLWGAVLAAVEARAWPRRPISPVLSLALGHAFAPDIGIYGFGTLFAPPPVFVRAYIGLDVRIF